MNDFAAEARLHHTRLRQLFNRVQQRIAVEDRKARVLARLERTRAIVEAQRIRRVDRVGIEHREEIETLVRIPRRATGRTGQRKAALPGWLDFIRSSRLSDDGRMRHLATTSARRTAARDTIVTWARHFEPMDVQQAASHVGH
jgi:hypothetical protein